MSPKKITHHTSTNITMIKNTLFIVLALFIIGGSVYLVSKQGYTPKGIMWSDTTNNPTNQKPSQATTTAQATDPHGCVTKDGFMWDGKKKKCVQIWAGITAAQHNPNTPNPASIRCKEDGGVSVVTKDAKGIERGTCTLKSGTICNEWAYFRGDCK